MIHCLFLINRQGKVRLTKWYTQKQTTMEQQKIIKDVILDKNTLKILIIK